MTINQQAQKWPGAKDSFWDQPITMQDKPILDHFRHDLGCFDICLPDPFHLAADTSIDLIGKETLIGSSRLTPHRSAVAMYIYRVEDWYG